MGNAEFTVTHTPGPSSLYVDRRRIENHALAKEYLIPRSPKGGSPLALPPSRIRSCISTPLRPPPRPPQCDPSTHPLMTQAKQNKERFIHRRGPAQPPPNPPTQPTQHSVQAEARETPYSIRTLSISLPHHFSPQPTLDSNPLAALYLILFSVPYFSFSRSVALSSPRCGEAPVAPVRSLTCAQMKSIKMLGAQLLGRESAAALSRHSFLPPETHPAALAVRTGASLFCPSTGIATAKQN